MFAKSKIQAIGLLAAVSVASFAAGATIKRADATPPTDWRERCSYSGMLKDRLGLSETQRDSIRTLMRSRSPAMRALMGPIQPQVDSLRTDIHEKVRAVLSAEQRSLYDSLIARDRDDRRDSTAGGAREGR
jgi:Spy/CpxP family protein refolding chaperone